jgi:hypothetical protein
MNQKHIGILLLVFGIIIGIFTVYEKIRENQYINIIIEKNDGSCFLDDGTCLHAGENWLPYMFGGMVSFTLLLLGGYFIFLRKEEQIAGHKEIAQGITKDNPKAEKKQFDFNDDENTVLAKIKEAEGTIFQSDLVEKTGFTKVKVTRLLDKLEGKGIIERKRRGMTNVVLLSHK